MPTLAELQPLIRSRARMLSAASDGRVPVDDVAQIGLLAAHAVLQRPGAEEEGLIRARALLAARGHMVDAVRIETRHRRDPDQQRAYRTLPLTAAARVPDPAPGPEECAMWRQFARLLAAAIEQLPHPHRLAIGVDVTEPGVRAAVARQLGVHPSRVSQLRTAAVGMLRARLAA